MGKASSSKKVARAAGIGGGKTAGRRTPWSYYSVLVVIVILGVVGVWNAKDRRIAQINSQGNSAPTVGTNWHEAYAVDICGKIQPPIKTTKNPYGITTKGDDVIYISPTVKSAAGKNATLGKFATAVGMQLNGAEVQLPGGRLYRDGDLCNGKAGHLYVMTWNNPTEPQADGKLATQTANVVHLQDQWLITIAFVPATDKRNIPQPPASAIAKLNQLTAAASSTTTAPSPATVPTPSTTAPASSSSTATSSTTAPASTTTVPAHSTTTKAATTSTTK